MNATLRPVSYEVDDNGCQCALASIREICQNFSMGTKEPYTYAQVEAALASVFGMAASDRGRFRARIQHLRRLGFFPEGPGRGKVVAYDFTEAARMLVAIELEAFGCDPKSVVAFLAKNWARSRGSKRPATSVSELVATASAAAPAGTKDIFVITHLDFLNQLSPIRTGDGHLDGLRAVGNYISQDNKALRVGMFNLSSRMRALQAALENA